LYWVETMPSAGLFSFLPFERERIRLRRLREDDLSRFLAYRSDPAVARFQGWAPMSPAQAADTLHDYAACADHPAGAWRQFAIAAADDDGLLGDLGLWLADDGREAEIGLSVAPAAQGQGVGAAAVRAVCDLLFAHTRVRCVRAAADTRNAACLRMLARAGLHETGRQPAVWKGEPCVDVAFARFKGAD
jgi:aminoglycoside 6'-N-acetyltransferase